MFAVGNALRDGLVIRDKTWITTVERASQRDSTDLLAHNMTHVFLHGVGAERILHTIERAPFPKWIHEEGSGTWMIESAKPQTVSWTATGSWSSAAT